GPSAIRYAGLNQMLVDLGYSVKDDGDIYCCTFETGNMGDPKLRFLEDIVNHSQTLSEHVKNIVKKGNFPLILGGDHSITIGSVAGLTFHYEQIGLIYMDAHGDFNTPETTESGNIHGMALATISGRGHPHLIGLGAKIPMVNDKSIALIGIRELDPLEKKSLKDSNITVFTIKDIDELGISEVMAKAIDIVTKRSGEQSFHFSFDIDSVEPSVAPGTGTTVPGGLTYREAHLACELIAESQKMVSMDLVEINPILDYANKTGKLAVEFISSALGKKIL
ncbi:MAG: arginase, partial [Candidatus Hermodarchaeota archaeon]